MAGNGAKDIDRAFPPLESLRTRVLILGSMPSQTSLELNQYYGHPQNAFWRIMQGLTGVDVASSYKERAQALMAQGISVWDTIASCHRPGSMDADIAPDTVTVNDFDAFIEKHSDLELVLFNGQASAKTFVKHLGKDYLFSKRIRSIVMPSTSPAYAAMPFEEKKSQWLETLTQLERDYEV